jgi:uncharacterized protein (TIGR00106 family)
LAIFEPRSGVRGQRPRHIPLGYRRMRGCGSGCRRSGAHPSHPRWKGSEMLVAFSLTPLGVGEDVGRVVAEAVRVVRASGLPNRTDSMFTTIEGDWDEVMDVIRSAVEKVQEYAPRVSMVLRADIRPSVSDGLTSKVDDLERYLSEDQLSSP